MPEKQIDIRNISLILLLSALTACQSTKQQAYDYSANARIGLFNIIPSQATHIDPGITIFNRLENEYEVDWNIPEKVNGLLKDGFKDEDLVSLKTPAWLEDEWEKALFADSGQGRPGISKKYLRQIQAICTDAKLDGILFATTFIGDRHLYTKVTGYVSGYGLHTQPGLGNGPAHSYANIAVFLMNCSTFSISHKVQTSNSYREKLDTFVEPKGTRVVSQEEIEKTRYSVEDIVEQVIKKFFVGFETEDLYYKWYP